MALLIEHDKKFIIWANNNCITYKEVFPLIKENKMWLGYMSNKTCHFRIPNDYEKYDKKFTEQRNDGYRYATVPAISTFTNLDIPKRHFELLPSLKKEFANHPELYQKYDNYDAINVDKVKDIPYDYHGVMGVPITFFDKFNPDEFEIIGMSQRGCHPEEMELKKYDDYYEMTKDKKKTGSSGSKTNGNPNLSQNDGKHNYFENKEGHIVQSCYQRVFIKRKEKRNAK